MPHQYEKSVFTTEKKYQLKKRMLYEIRFGECDPLFYSLKENQVIARRRKKRLVYYTECAIES